MPSGITAASAASRRARTASSRNGGVSLLPKQGWLCFLRLSRAFLSTGKNTRPRARHIHPIRPSDQECATDLPRKPLHGGRFLCKQAIACGARWRGHAHVRRHHAACIGTRSSVIHGEGSQSVCRASAGIKRTVPEHRRGTPASPYARSSLLCTEFGCSNSSCGRALKAFRVVFLSEPILSRSSRQLVLSPVRSLGATRGRFCTHWLQSSQSIPLGKTRRTPLS